MAATKYLVFDVESVADGPLVAKLRYPHEALAPSDAVSRYRQELMAKHGHDFIPYTFQVPVAVAVAKVRGDFTLEDVVALDEPNYRPHEITSRFWRGWELYGQPTLVSFNGRGFDLPLLELAAFRFGLSLPGWFANGGGNSQTPRYRFNALAHLDLFDLFTNHGATRFAGGLDLAANLLGKPGKMEIEGHMVQDLFEAGKHREISDYCRCDVLDTYFVFLRSRVLVGALNREREHELVVAAKQWLEARTSESAAFANYLSRWGDWHDPWKS